MSWPRGSGGRVASKRAAPREKPAARVVFVSSSFLPDALCSVLWNLYHYYKQFSDQVQAKIAELRSPLEKELKVRGTAVILTLGRTKAASSFPTLCFDPVKRGL